MIHAYLHLTIESHFRYQSHTHIRRTDTYIISSVIYIYYLFVCAPHTLHLHWHFICLFSRRCILSGDDSCVRLVVSNYHWSVNSLSSCWICHILNAITTTHIYTKTDQFWMGCCCWYVCVCAHICVRAVCAAWHKCWFMFFVCLSLPLLPLLLLLLLSKFLFNFQVQCLSQYMNAMAVWSHRYTYYLYTLSDMS